jgi:hypothetical protein
VKRTARTKIANLHIIAQIPFISEEICNEQLDAVVGGFDLVTLPLPLPLLSDTIWKLHHDSTAKRFGNPAD